MFFMCWFTLWWSRAFQQRRFGPPSLVFVGTQGWCLSYHLVNLEWFGEISLPMISIQDPQMLVIFRHIFFWVWCVASCNFGIFRLPSIDPQEHVYDTFNANSETWINVQQCETDKPPLVVFSGSFELKENNGQARDLCDSCTDYYGQKLPKVLHFANLHPLSACSFSTKAAFIPWCQVDVQPGIRIRSVRWRFVDG